MTHRLVSLKIDSLEVDLLCYSFTDDFLGRAVLNMSDLRQMPSSRQIIPLTGRPRARGTQSGSLTVEVSKILFFHSDDCIASKLHNGGLVKPGIIIIMVGIEK